MRWRLLLKEYGPEIVYIKGKANVVADALSRHPKQGDIVEDVEAVLPLVPVDTTISPIQLQEVHELKEQDRLLRKKVQDNSKEFSKQTIDQVTVIAFKNRIYLPKKLC